MAIYEIIQSPPPKTMCSKNGEKIISLMCHFFPKMNFSAPRVSHVNNQSLNTLSLTHPKLMDIQKPKLFAILFSFLLKKY